MSKVTMDHIHVPTLEDLQKAVVPRRPAPAASPGLPESAAKVRMPSEGATAAERLLSPEAENFLRHAVAPHLRALTLEERWKVLEVTSGSKKKSILDELRGQGYMRLERKGRRCRVHLYRRAYEYLGLPVPTGKGVGGITHQVLARHVAGLLKSKGYEVHIEREIGPRRKRVDVAGFGKDRIIGVEIGLSDERQEIKNLREDLESGVLDLLLFVTTDEAMLDKVKARAKEDPIVNKHIHRIRFLLLDEEDIS